MDEPCVTGGQRSDGKGLCPRFADAFVLDAEHAVFDLTLDPSNWTGGFGLQRLNMTSVLTQLEIILPDLPDAERLALTRAAGRGGLRGQAERHAHEEKKAKS
ncbi:hypothetical protein [Litorimonas sp. WD9-15]|uniref:hypothetical protein n=1 Tax=Litorimonas sp. WD9-15 TaxID=3418716 RepID=UPI003D092E80